MLMYHMFYIVQHDLMCRCMVPIVPYNPAYRHMDLQGAIFFHMLTYGL